MRERERINHAVERAARLIAMHPAVEDVSASTENGRPGAVVVDVAVRLGLPNEWMADGISPNGVRAVEKVKLSFPPLFPLRPPRIHLRPDFDRSLAHVNPGSPADDPEPCIYEGSLAELLQQQGPAEIINQLVHWLENAALERLIDPKQGWEPVRRDSLQDYIVADAAHLRSQVARHEEFSFFRFDYLHYRLGEARFAYHGEVGRERVPVNAKAVRDLFRQSSLRSSADTKLGQTLAIFVWPGRQPSGKPFVAERYFAETVVDLASLVERAAIYGCAGPLQNAFDWLRQCVASYRTELRWPLAVILCARRPMHMINSDSSLELCPYLVEIGAPELFPEGDRTRVRPAGHRDVIATPLLRRMSGSKPDGETPPWIQLGAGSLGSKIALHLARAGRAPTVIVDRGFLSPHNAARHALVPGPGPMQISWLTSKAEALASAVRGLGQTAEAHVEDLIEIAHDADRAKQLLPKRAWAVVNSTAALAVREALASVPSRLTIPRVIETTLFANGRVGLLSIEGPKRSPNSGDLITEAYVLMREDPCLCDLIFSRGGDLRWQVVGEGCGSATMIISDARISAMAAPMAEALAALQQAGLPSSGGRILLGTGAADGLSQSWSSYEVAPWLHVAVEGKPAWHVRISERAHQKIVADVCRWTSVETGGILFGRLSDAAQTFYIADVLPPPEDSTRSASEFVLGTAGIRATLKDLSESCRYSLYCLGTWHSHLAASGPSARDYETATAVGIARLMPSVLLIRTPAGYRAVLAESPEPALWSPG